MTFRNSITIGLWCTVIFSANIIAGETMIYRWLDENNVVHYSQHQPQSGNYSQLTTVSSFQTRENPPVKNVKKPSVDDQISQYEKERAEVLAKNAEIAEKNCKAAKLNEQMLNSFNHVMMTDSDGKESVMSNEEKKSQLELSKKHIKMYCTKDNINKN